MGSKTYEGIRFSVYSNDHSPPHVHGFSGGVTVIVDLLPGREVDLANRTKAVAPANAKRSIVAKVLRVAADNFDELMALWEKTHGNAR